MKESTNSEIFIGQPHEMLEKGGMQVCYDTRSLHVRRKDFILD